MLRENIAFENVISHRDYQASLGQFMTPEPIARFMASWLCFDTLENNHVLDAGAGQGMLSSALNTSCNEKSVDLCNAKLTVFEIDESLIPILKDNLSKLDFSSVDIQNDDFIRCSVECGETHAYSHAILNPPYKKISSKSEHRSLLRSVGIETGNMYSAFVALALLNSKENGQIVAIIPRSFCNGPYFKPFREFILDNSAITNIHLFESRKQAFQQDGVLQENVIIRLVKGQKQGDVEITSSFGTNLDDVETSKFSFEQIVQADDADKFIHIPTSKTSDKSTKQGTLRVTLADIDAQISTGPVVGFRLKEHLRDNLDKGSVPLIYPAHLRHGRVRWPLEDSGKANAISQNEETQKWLYPNGNYCIVRRFSSKEERHRIVASVVEANDFPDDRDIGLDNKLNVFHFNKSGLDRNFAHGLAAYLNTDLVDEEFRLFSGHTQVNATDLRKMKYPERELLIQLGEKLLSGSDLSHEEIYKALKI